jgi:CHAT domain-containing protein
MNSRLVVGAVCGALLLYALGPFSAPADKAVSHAAAIKAQNSTAASELSYQRDYEEFVQRLGEFQGGDAAALEALRTAAKRLAQRHQRPDALRVVDYYADLSAEARAQGLEARERVNEFHARAEGHGVSDWKEQRPLLLRDIEAFVARTLPQGEFSPAGNALALAAEIRVDWSAARARENDEHLRRARQDALEAIALFERAGMQTPQLRPRLQLGRLAVLEAKEAEARQCFEECLNLARACRQTQYAADSLVALIRMARRAGDEPELEARLTELSRIQTPEQSWELAREHAMLWLHRDEPQRAAEFLLRHRPIEMNEVRVWRQILAAARVRMDDLAGARALLDGLEQDEHGDAEDLTLLRATLHLAEGDTAAVIPAMQVAFQAGSNFSERGRSRAAVLLGEAYLREGHPDLALVHLSHARRLAESWEARMEAARPSARSSATVLGEWLGLHAIVLEAMALCDLERALEAAVLIERAHAQRWRAAARADHITSGSQPEALSEADLKAWAAHYSHGLVTWISGADNALAVHIDRRGQASVLSIQQPRRDVSRATQRHRAALINGELEHMQSLGQEIVDALLPSSLLRSLGLPEGTQDSLLLLPHGALESLCFESLPWQTGNLDERLALTVLPELPTRRPGQLNPTAGPWSLFGDPLDELGVQRLPASGEELKQLHVLLPEAQLFSGEQLTEGSLLQALSEGRSIHIATHLDSRSGCPSPRFATVGIELSRGQVLCAEKVAVQSNQAPLVVLATCSSASGRQVDGRGLQGIARAFLDGGTRNLLVTLWPVRDQVAQQFSGPYHAALLAGQSPSQAARSARRALAQAGLAPVDWAAFRALGRD